MNIQEELTRLYFDNCAKTVNNKRHSIKLLAVDETEWISD